MKVVARRPPNYAEIAAALGEPPPNAVFAWAGVVYSPSGRELPDELVVHERVHFEQQSAIGGPDAWWSRYLTEPGFRLEQEVEAYRAQIASHETRAERRACLRRVARDLAGPMYGGLVTVDEARALLWPRAPRTEAA